MVSLDITPQQHPEASKKSYTCGSCVWFTQGFAGTCQTYRGITVSTPACVEYQQPSPDPLDEIYRDKYIIGLRESLKHPRFRLDQSLTQELTGYLLDEDLTRLHAGTLQDLTAIMDVLRKILSFRSRVSTIYTSVLDVKHELQEKENYATLWLYSKHSKLMKDVKNAPARKAAFDRVFPEMVSLWKMVDKLEATAKYVDDRLDANERLLTKILQSSERIWFSKGNK